MRWFGKKAKSQILAAGRQPVKDSKSGKAGYEGPLSLVGSVHDISCNSFF
jgi:hypothetical protein